MKAEEKNYSGGGRGPVIREGEMREGTNKNKMQLYIHSQTYPEKFISPYSNQKNKEKLYKERSCLTMAFPGELNLKSLIIHSFY